MTSIKKCFIICLLFFMMPLSLHALETDEVKKINFSEIDGEEGNNVTYNADEARIETSHPAGDTLLKTELFISSYDAIVPYKIFSFELGNQMAEDMEFTVKIIGENEYTLSEKQAIILEGEQLVLSYQNEGTFLVPGNFAGRVYIPMKFESEHIQTVELYSRNKKSDIAYYTSSFRVMNLTENEFINDLLNSKLTANQKQVSNSLSEKYQVEYIPIAGFIDLNGNFERNEFIGTEKIEAQIKDQENTQILYNLNLGKLEAVKEEKTVEVNEQIIAEVIVKPIEIRVDGFLSNKDLSEKVLPLMETIPVITPKNSFVMSGVFTFLIVIGYIGAFALAIYAVIYLVKDFIGK